MDQNPGLDYVVRSLAIQTPILLVAIIGFFVALMFVRRAPSAALMTIIAMLLMGGAMLMGAVGQGLMIQSMQNTSVDHSHLGKWMTLLGVFTTCVRGVAFALLVTAVFVGRPPAYGK